MNDDAGEGSRREPDGKSPELGATRPQRHGDEAVEPEAALRAGLALYADGEFHAAHDPWEAAWLGLDPESDDEHFFHGLIQVTASVFHVREHNWTGAAGLAASAADYLEPLPTTHRGVALDPVRDYCRAVAADPETTERRTPPPLPAVGESVGYLDLAPDAAPLAAEALAEEYGYDESVIDDAAEFARVDRTRGDSGGRSTFTSLLVDFLSTPERRGVVFQRLTAHVERRRRERDDVRGLFE